MTTTITLVRHGETDWNIQKKIQGSSDTELNTNGIRQAEQLGQKLQQMYNHSDSEIIQYTAIYSSRQKRAMKTGEIIGTFLGLTCLPLPGLEEINLGKWEGMSWDDVKKHFPKEYAAWYQNRRYTRPPQGESYQDLLDRILTALQKLIQKEHGNILIVTHSADIMTLLSYIYDTPFQDMHKNYRTGNAETVLLKEAEIQRILAYSTIET